MARLHTERLLTANEVAEMFGVHPKTVLNWATKGKLACVHTPSGRRLFPESVVRECMRWTEGNVLG